jgi:deoxyribonuclease IV
MSIAGGLPKAVERARSVAATALQVFVKSSNQWAARPFAAGEAEEFRKAASDAALTRHTLAHASYLINLASPDPALWERSVVALAEELDRCEALAIPWLVVHPGSHVGAGVAAGLDRVVRALDRALAGRSAESAGVLVENTAGQGRTLGSTFEELGEILTRVSREDRLGVCFDTCHAFAAGHEIRDAGSYRATMKALDRAVGLDRVHGFHLNDAKGELGGHLDRHEHIGRGALGLETFRLIVNDRRFAGRPMILETPKDDDLAEDRVNLGVLRSLVSA